jgi:lipid-A-disaccharide synthase
LSGRLLLSCGEASGDLYAGALTRELRAVDPMLQVAGLGGPRFAGAGGDLLADYRGLAATGLTEAVATVPRFLATLNRLVRSAEERRPDALILIDSPELNFRLARKVKRLGVPIVYYVTPQVWAWRRQRLAAIKSFSDLVLPIFPFEEALYREHGVPVEYVGHPLVDLASPAVSRATLLEGLGLELGRPTVALLPGSRTNEVRAILPGLTTAALLIASRLPDVQFVIARAPNLADDFFIKAASNRGVRLAVSEGQTDAVLAAADVAITASGTATVQAALHDTPMVIVYKLSPITYRLGRRLVHVSTYGMVNLIAGEMIVPELIQDAFTAEAVAAEVISMLTDRSKAARVREGLAAVRQKLGGPGASARAARAILALVGKQTR